MLLRSCAWSLINALFFRLRGRWLQPGFGPGPPACPARLIELRLDQPSLLCCAIAFAGVERAPLFENLEPLPVGDLIQFRFELRFSLSKLMSVNLGVQAKDEAGRDDCADDDQGPQDFGPLRLFGLTATSASASDRAGGASLLGG
jgi:hypothetical protein